MAEICALLGFLAAVLAAAALGAAAAAGSVAGLAVAAGADAAGSTARTAVWHDDDRLDMFFCRHCSAGAPPVGTPAQTF